MTEQLIISLVVTAGALVLALGALRQRNLSWTSVLGMVAAWAIIFAVVATFIGFYMP